MVKFMSENVKTKKLFGKIDTKSPIVSAGIATLALMLVFGVMNPTFWKPANLATVLLNASVIGIFTASMTMVMISGNIDLSTTSTAAVSVMFFGMLYEKGMPIIPGVLLGIVAGALCGLVNGLLIAKAHLPSLMVTIGTQFAYRAVAYSFTDVRTITITEPAFFKFGRMRILGLPVSVYYMIIFMLVFAYILNHTAFGRRVYAIGGNLQASYYNGINIEKTQIQIYVIMGTVSAFAGMVTAAQSAACAPVTLTGREFDFVSPAVIGGVAMSGGKGKMLGAFVGCILLAVVSNGMVLVGLQSYWQNFVKGLILIFAMWVDAIRNKQDLA